MLNWWQHIPEYINPIIFQIGFFSVRWYSLMYLVGFAVVYGLLVYRKRRMANHEVQSSKFKVQSDNSKLKINSKIQDTKYKVLNTISISDLIVYLITGLLIGARLAYVIFYNLSYYLAHPLEIIFPVQITNYQLQITGIYGMSYFGGLIGVVAAGLVFVRLRGSASPPAGRAGLNQSGQKRPNLFYNFWRLADFVVPAVPAGYFFGRIGNFLNGELYGRVTSVPWGMYFPADPYGLLRHPSQLYEAFFEGIVLFAVLWILHGKSIGLFEPLKKFKRSVDSSCDRNPSQLESNGSLFLIYLFGYGLFRFFIEFFREPDPAQAGLFFGCLSLGQVFSAMAIITAVLIALVGKNRHFPTFKK